MGAVGLAEFQQLGLGRLLLLHPSQTRSTPPPPACLLAPAQQAPT
jgi:hypothetical protein